MKNLATIFRIIKHYEIPKKGKINESKTDLIQNISYLCPVQNKQEWMSLT